MSTLNVAEKDGIAYLTLNRPDKKNSLTLEMIEEIDRFIRSGPIPTVIVFKGEGGFFSAGADISYFENLSGADAASFSVKGNEVMDRIQRLDAVSIASIEGGAYGGGLELALSCDIRVASPKAKLGLTEINLGILPGWGGMKRISSISGRGVAKLVALTGRVFEGKEAYELGLISVLSDSPSTYVDELAMNLSKKSGESIKRIKSLINSEPYRTELEAKLFGEVIETDFARNAVKKFLRK